MMRALKKELDEKERLEKLMPKPILDDVERRYLKNVIRPFKDKVSFVKKSSNGDGIRYIAIELFNLEDYDCIFLPYFKDETMYRGMELDKEYTLQELGIEEE